MDIVAIRINSSKNKEVAKALKFTSSDRSVINKKKVNFLRERFSANQKHKFDIILPENSRFFIFVKKLHLKQYIYRKHNS
jgi:hypothetical protein